MMLNQTREDFVGATTFWRRKLTEIFNIQFSPIQYQYPIGIFKLGFNAILDRFKSVVGTISLVLVS